MKIGSLCTGYGGLDQALNGDLAWVSDIDRYANTFLEHRHPNVPNHGDLTAIDWSNVEPVDIITAGYPCQPFSVAGNRKGTNDERHIWPHIAAGIRALRPRAAFFENVAGHLSVGLAEVLADLAEIRFDARWVSLRASDVGAPHKRERIFILATDTDRGRFTQRTQRDPEQANRIGAPHRNDPERPDQAPAHTDGARREGETSARIQPAEPTDSPRLGASTDWREYSPAVATWERRSILVWRFPVGNWNAIEIAEWVKP